MRKPLLLIIAALCASSTGAHAVGWSTQINCASDYYAYCSQHSPGSPGVRKCMRAAGPKLSKACIDALIADGEVSKAEVDRQREKYAAAKSKPKSDEAAKKSEDLAKKIDDAAKKSAVAAVKKPEPDTKKPAPKLAAAPARETSPAPKPVAARRTEPKPAATASVTAPALAGVKLDDVTFAALKSRGDRFILDGEENAEVAGTETPAPAATEAVAATDQQLTSEPEPQPATSSSSWQAAAPKQARLNAPEASQDAEDVTLAPAPVASVDEAQQDGEPRQYPPGRMSLGRNLSTADASKQGTSWWDELVRTFTGE